ncbi:unnamed protein product [Coffea canephora]|uniref:DH200=94 genomic scaffold, scaffold_1709 n=1 Tax=Coffea canephora TaxID=49390 RepID=A0A068VIY8_COFCA|nr:unnamed protein product [Coffea canephora]
MWGFRSSSTLANIFLLLLVAMNLSVSHVSAPKQFQNETDRLALLEFKNRIYDDPFGVLKSWNHSQHHCHWEGVTCSARHQRVVALTLREKHLSGTISPHVGNLSFMRFIQLPGNQFHGEIPQEFGRLFRLRALNLSINALVGEIPANLSYSIELINISLRDNKLEGKIPIDQLSNLKKLENFYLYKNNFTGEIPSSIGNLSSLIRIGFSLNNLEGNLPVEMGLLKRLSFFSVAENKLSGIIPASIFNSSAIILFSVAANSFHGNLPTNIGHTLPNLQELYLGGNKFYGNFPTSITNASGLDVLDLPTNKFKGQIPTNLGDLTQLKLLNLAANFFGNNSTGDLDFIASLTNCSNLRILSLSINTFGGNVPKVMANLSHQLAELYMGWNQLSGTIPEGFGHLSIQQLDLSSNNLTGPIPKELEKLQYLRYLNLSYNNIEGEIPNTGIFSNAKYGMGHAASTPGDVYSYGILLLEMITKRRPTDDMFMDELDIHNYVNRALHEQVSEIVDPLLLFEGRDENRRITHGEETINGGRQIHCIISLLKIGLKCSAKLPNDRMHMNEVVRKLHLIKDVLLGLRVHQENLQV